RLAELPQQPPQVSVEVAAVTQINSKKRAPHSHYRTSPIDSAVATCQVEIQRSRVRATLDKPNSLRDPLGSIRWRKPGLPRKFVFCSAWYIIVYTILHNVLFAFSLTLFGEYV
ncbi:MAG: hypothetical protein KC547_05815, partial [Anaerolineae bacterium]|nr:hypothetical protein [Anaerolineae bacterium]